MERPRPPHPERKASPIKGPIIACIGPEYFFTEADDQRLEDLIDDLDAEYIDYFGGQSEQRTLRQKNAGEHSYVISGISSRAKFSTEYLNCTGLIAVGIDKETGKNVSFLSHQDPGFFLAAAPQYEAWRKSFLADLTSTLKDFKERVREETIDVVMVGGNYYENETSVAEEGKTLADDYRDSVTFLANHVRTVLLREPQVVIGPQTQQGGMAVVFDTERRRLYMFRADQAEYSKDVSFPARAIDTLMAKWRSKKKSKK